MYISLLRAKTTEPESDVIARIQTYAQNPWPYTPKLPTNVLAEYIPKDPPPPPTTGASSPPTRNSNTHKPTTSNNHETRRQQPQQQHQRHQRQQQQLQQQQRHDNTIDTTTSRHINTQASRASLTQETHTWRWSRKARIMIGDIAGILFSFKIVHIVWCV